MDPTGIHYMKKHNGNHLSNHRSSTAGTTAGLKQRPFFSQQHSQHWVTLWHHCVNVGKRTVPLWNHAVHLPSIMRSYTEIWSSCVRHKPKSRQSSVASLTYSRRRNSQFTFTSAAAAAAVSFYCKVETYNTTQRTPTNGELAFTGRDPQHE